MFSIQIELKPATYCGLQALDHRRILRLPDDITLRTSEARSDRRTIPISEALARLFFSPTQMMDSLAISFDLLTPEDVETQDFGVIALRKDLAEARILELYLAEQTVRLVESLQTARLELQAAHAALEEGGAPPPRSAGDALRAVPPHTDESV